MCLVPGVAVLSDGVIAVVKAAVMVTRAFIWQDTAITLNKKKDGSHLATLMSRKFQ